MLQRLRFAGEKRFDLLFNLQHQLPNQERRKLNLPVSAIASS
jgi:hypothetical protein